MQITHYLTFNADQRISMQVYANSLKAVLTDTQFVLDQFKPVSRLERFSQSRLIMRLLRYVHYPLFLRIKALKSLRQKRSTGIEPSKVHHVLDHGYAHLANALGSGAKVITVHDVIPFLAWRGLIEGLETTFAKPWLNLWSLRYLNNFDVVIASSEASKQDLVRYFELQSDKIQVIPPVLDACFRFRNPEEVSAFKDKMAFKDDVFYILISGREYYKNHRRSLLAIKALEDKTERSIQIVRMGHPDSDFDALVNELGLCHITHSVGFLTRSEQALLYAAVDCLLFPSLYEGFGMPVVEAVACGCPAIISNSGALAEFESDRIVRVSATDVVSIEKGILALLENRMQKDQATVSESVNRFLTPYRSDAVKDALFKVYKMALDAEKVRER